MLKVSRYLLRPLCFGLVLFFAGLPMATVPMASGSLPTTDPVSTNTCVGKWQDSDASDECTSFGVVGGSDGNCRFSGYCPRDDGSANFQGWGGPPDDMADLQNCNGVLQTSC